MTTLRVVPCAEDRDKDATHQANYGLSIRPYPVLVMSHDVVPWKMQSPPVPPAR
jgi:hypothetical protein